MALRTGGPDLRPLAHVKWDRSRIALMVLGRLGAGMEDDFIRMELWGMRELFLGRVVNGMIGECLLVEEIRNAR